MDIKYPKNTTLYNIRYVKQILYLNSVFLIVFLKMKPKYSQSSDDVIAFYSIA